jgi:hypothetical protein
MKPRGKWQNYTKEMDKLVFYCGEKWCFHALGAAT